MKKIKEIGHIRLIGLIGPISLISLIGLTTSCRNSREEVEPTQEPEPAGVAITFSGLESDEQEQTAGVKGTRAGQPLSNLGILKFRVWGYKNMSYDSRTGSYESPQLVFPGYTVNYKDGSAASTTTNTNGWEYVAQQESGDDQQTIKYWDFNANAYRFFAVTKWGGEVADPAAKAEETYDTYGTYETYGAYGAYETYGVYEAHEPDEATGEYPAYAVSMRAKARVWDGSGDYDKDATAAEMAATPYFSRLWFSNGNLVAYPDKQFGKPVQLEFLKPYARVRYIYKYVYPREGLTLSGQTFKPTTDYTDEDDDKVKIPMSGTVTVIYPLTGTATREWYTVTPDADNRLEAFTEDFDAEDDTKVYTDTDDGWYMVLPCTSQGSYTLQVTINTKIKTETKSCVVPAEYMRWLPGYSYTYIFKINEEGGIEIELVEAAVTPWTELGTARTVYNW